MDEEANVVVANERHIVVVMPNLPDCQAIFVDNFVHAVVGILTREEFFSVFSEFDADSRQRISMTREGDVVVFKHLTRTSHIHPARTTMSQPRNLLRFNRL